MGADRAQQPSAAVSKATTMLGMVSKEFQPEIWAGHHKEDAANRRKSRGEAYKIGLKLEKHELQEQEEQTETL